MIPEKLLTLSITPKKGRRVVLEAACGAAGCEDDDVCLVVFGGGCS